MSHRSLFAKRTKISFIWATVGLALLLVGTRVNAQLPADFPGVTVTTYNTNAVGEGYIFLEVTDSATNGSYVMLLDNTGSTVGYQNVTNRNYDFKVLPNGYLHFARSLHDHSGTDGGDVTHQILDANLNAVETIAAGNGYVADSHDFQLLPNGHVLLFGYYQTPMDVSKYVTGGYSNALVGGAVIQELDADRNVVFQWRAWDHFDFTNYFPAAFLTNPIAKAPVIEAFHLNAIVLDTDGDLLVSNFGMDVWKISRQTGDILWRLGGSANQFSFVGVTSPQALEHFSNCNPTRLDNGNLLFYCNADQSATRSAKVCEYTLDEINKIATLVWSYTPPANYYAWHYGSAQRLPNGNTFIGWGSANILPGIGGTTNQAIPACTEVKPDGTVVFQMKFNDPRVASSRGFRFIYPPGAQASANTVYAPEDGNTYDFSPTGVAITVNEGGGGYYSTLTVSREPYAPVNPQFEGKAPRVLPWRVSVSSELYPLDTVLEFDAGEFGFADPANLTVCYRAQTGEGVFQPLPTAYNPLTGKVLAAAIMDGPYFDLGEFIFSYPDVADVTNSPILAAPENYRGSQPFAVVGPLPAVPGTNYLLNQELPISLAWSPKGLAARYRLQIAANVNFTSPIVDMPNQTQAFHVWSNAAPGTTYYYRVNTSNEAGTSGWANGSFQTVALTDTPIVGPTITSIRQNPDGTLVLEWNGATTGVNIEFSPTLAPTQWQPVAGPVSGSTWTNTPQATPKGFYRLRLQ